MPLIRHILVSSSSSETPNYHLPRPKNEDGLNTLFTSLVWITCDGACNATPGKGGWDASQGLGHWQPFLLQTCFRNYGSNLPSVILQ
jgi:hypothetical protein